MGYDRYVRDQLSGRAEVYYPEENCRFSGYVLRYAREWITKACEPETVTLVHFNCGLWDVVRLDGDGPLTPMAYYEDNLRRIVARLRLVCPNAKLVFATTTSVNEAGYNPPVRMMYNAEIDEYNACARRVMEELHVPIDDLAPVSKALGLKAHSDEVHFYTPEGTKALGDAVTRSILSALS